MEQEHTTRPRFSIVIPTFNTTGVLRECLYALYHQSEDSRCFEVIVVNDGGKQQISDEIDSFGSEQPIRYFYQDHKGPAAARNLGIAKAKGEIVLFLDDDSLPTPNWLSATMKAWETYFDFDGIGGYIASELTDNIYCRVNADFFNWYLEQQSSQEISSFLVTCNAGYKKVTLNKLGSFDERFKNASGEDRDLNIRITKNGGKLKLDKNILVYHDRDLSFRSFVRKNFNYGKAAYNIYTRYPEQKYVSAKGYVTFYVSILKKYRTLQEKLIAFFLLTLSQTATATGYYTAFFSKQEAKATAQIPR